jgi:hypothetical protein
VTAARPKRSTDRSPARGGSKSIRTARSGGAASARSQRKPEPRKTGRPASSLPADALTRIGAPPTDRADRARWLGRISDELLWLTMRGEIASELAGTIRAWLKQLDQQLAPALQAELDRIQADDEASIAATVPGPQLEPLDHTA